TTDSITCDRCDASILLLLQPGHEGLTMHFNLLTASSTSTPIADGKNRKAKQSSIHYCITGHLISVQANLRDEMIGRRKNNWKAKEHLKCDLLSDMQIKDESAQKS
ncbi:hypothetical protein WUBG_01812, partial [Wuchereria bancrofti]